ncbi:hypothetical protein Q648_00761 [Bartonella quintana JK 12]|uniref:hypothetical protein n=1 Tax=Bartonella quintana TaxID=803 RepID=UPI0003DF9471|nr:hypothetical protein [Bartonella quintana]ETS18223.1 hypothetical protein Q647_01172 [Bartonella quintana JK 7]ETS19052.1 hypothetical protein Q648_00761 [Bartonella quintana JK 12]
MNSGVRKGSRIRFWKRFPRTIGYDGEAVRIDAAVVGFLIMLEVLLYIYWAASYRGDQYEKEVLGKSKPRFDPEESCYGECFERSFTFFLTSGNWNDITKTHQFLEGVKIPSYW